MIQDLMVSVCSTTYNHEQFIARTLEGFLMQKTNFKFEIIIGDDCSTDETTNILKAAEQKFPEKVRIFFSEKNVGAHLNFANTIQRCQGKYIALCDGDDYWTDCYKLQKQVDFMEQNLEYVICCHYTQVVDKDNNPLYVDPNPLPLVHTYNDLLVGKQVETKTATVLYRNFPEIMTLFEKPWFLKCFAADKILKLFATYKTGNKIYVLPEVMSCYRTHVGGIWSMIKTEARMEMMISDFNLIIRKFGYKRLQKYRLLLLYLQRYILFELRRRRLLKVYNTVKYLI